ncbi:hypothetical protein Br6_05076 [Rhodococcus sp. Br-6]|nr:hypothetical protein C8K36_12015 [Rhodococcus sp. OK519]GBF17669.1 hypothetical protein Br6_05076 [Rhodococcus sp. Br-6]
MSAPSVLFMCAKNGGKSQMAAGLMRAAADNTVDVHAEIDRTLIALPLGRSRPATGRGPDESCFGWWAGTTVTHATGTLSITGLPISAPDCEKSLSV